MTLLCLWEINDEVFQKAVHSKSELKSARFRGRKPIKMIININDVSKFGGKKVLRASIHPVGLIIATNGTVIHDGRAKRL
jgi:hypothetical protein